ncbi:hypothetical protein KCU81_g683, partial [Aureobasidium melanogenum]
MVRFFSVVVNLIAIELHPVDTELLVRFIDDEFQLNVGSLEFAFVHLQCTLRYCKRLCVHWSDQQQLRIKLAQGQDIIDAVNLSKHDYRDKFLQRGM